MECSLKVSSGSWKVGRKEKAEPALPKTLLQPLSLSPAAPLPSPCLPVRCPPSEAPVPPPLSCVKKQSAPFPEPAFSHSGADLGRGRKGSEYAGTGNCLSKQRTLLLKSFSCFNALWGHLGILLKGRLWFRRPEILRISWGPRWCDAAGPWNVFAVKKPWKLSGYVYKGVGGERARWNQQLQFSIFPVFLVTHAVRPLGDPSQHPLWSHNLWFLSLPWNLLFILANWIQT